jgi:hypothetical protein
MDVESVTSHVLVTHSTFFGSPLESSFNGILDFVKELNTLSNINEAVCTSGIWTKAPNLLGIIFIPVIFINQDLCSFFLVSSWSNFTFFNLSAEFII